eukprot:7672712-Alexandrium_andersonii.AAC.1
MSASLVGSEMCIRDRPSLDARWARARVRVALSHARVAWLAFFSGGGCRGARSAISSSARAGRSGWSAGPTCRCCSRRTGPEEQEP